MGDLFALGGDTDFPTLIDTADVQVNGPNVKAFSLASTHASKINALTKAVLRAEKHLFRVYINPVDPPFNAPGGGADSTAEIQAALNYAGTLAALISPGVVVVRFPADVYGISAPLNLPSNVSIDGNGAVLLALVDTDFIAATNQNFLGVEQLTFVGIGPLSNSKAAIHFTGCTNVLLDRLNITGQDFCIWLLSCQRVSIGIVTIEGANSTNGDGVILADCQNVDILSIVGHNYRKTLLYLSVLSTGGGQNQNINVGMISGAALAGSAFATGVAIRVGRGINIGGVALTGQAAGQGMVFIQTEAAPDTGVIEDVNISHIAVSDNGSYGVFVNGNNRAGSLRRINLGILTVDNCGGTAVVPSVLIQGVAMFTIGQAMISRSVGSDGIDITNCTDGNIGTLSIDTAQKYGVHIGAAATVTGLVINGLVTKDTSQLANNTYHDVFVTNSSTGIVIDSWDLRATAANKSSRGIFVNAGCSGVFLGSGYATGQVTQAIDNRATGANTPQTISTPNAAHTGDLLETTLFTGPLNANVMGTTKAFRIRAAGTVTNAAGGNKDIRLRFGGLAGTVILDITEVGAAADNWGFDVLLIMAGAANAQDWHVIQYQGATVGQAFVQSAINTAAATSLVITAQLANAGDTITLTMVELEPLN